MRPWMLGVGLIVAGIAVAALGSVTLGTWILAVGLFVAVGYLIAHLISLI